MTQQIGHLIIIDGPINLRTELFYVGSDLGILGSPGYTAQ